MIPIGEMTIFGFNKCYKGERVTVGAPLHGCKNRNKYAESDFIIKTCV